MADLLHDLAQYIIHNIEKGLAKDVYCDFTPDSPDKIIVLEEYAGSASVTGIKEAERNVQIKVRAAPEGPAWAKEKIWQIYNLLDTPLDRIHDLRGMDLPGVGERWMVLYARQTPFKLKVDENDRTIFAFNLGVTTDRD